MIAHRAQEAVHFGQQLERIKAHHALGNATRQGAPQRRQRHDSTTRPSCTWLASSVIAPTASHARHLVGGGGSRSVDRHLNHRHRRSGFASFA